MAEIRSSRAIVDVVSLLGPDIAVGWDVVFAPTSVGARRPDALASLSVVAAVTAEEIGFIILTVAIDSGNSVGETVEFSAETITLPGLS